MPHTSAASTVTPEDKTMPTARIRLVAAACVLLLPQLAFAAPNPANGRKLSQQFCAECHVVVPNGKAGWTDAPAFDAIANKPGTTTQFLRTFIQQPHMHMVNTGRPPGQAADIAAYILTLRTR